MSWDLNKIYSRYRAWGATESEFLFHLFDNLNRTKTNFTFYFDAPIYLSLFFSNYSSRKFLTIMNSPFFNFEIFSDAVFPGAWSENTGFKWFLRFVLFVLLDLAKMSTQLNLKTLSHSQTISKTAMRKYFWWLNSLNVVRSFQNRDEMYFSWAHSTLATYSSSLSPYLEPIRRAL